LWGHRSWKSQSQKSKCRNLTKAPTAAKQYCSWNINHRVLFENHYDEIWANAVELSPNDIFWKATAVEFHINLEDKKPNLALEKKRMKQLTLSIEDCYYRSRSLKVHIQKSNEKWWLVCSTSFPVASSRGLIINKGHSINEKDH